MNQRKRYTARFIKTDYNLWYIKLTVASLVFALCILAFYLLR